MKVYEGCMYVMKDILKMRALIRKGTTRFIYLLFNFKALYKEIQQI